MLKLEGSFWGKGKCPQCNRKYQKDLRLLWIWNTTKKKVLWLEKMCSWCFIIWYANLIKYNKNITIEWQNKKEDIIYDRN
jgi:hypothetical protein